MASLFLNHRRLLHLPVKVALRTATALLLLVFVSGCSSLLFYPSSVMVSTPANWQLAYEDVWLHSGDGTRLHGWWLPAQSPGEPPIPAAAKGTIYFLHGNAENISTHIANVIWLPGAGYNVFLIDYRGYGRSEGEPDLGPVIEDVRSGYRWLQGQQELPLIVLGQSLGGALGGFVAATETPAPAAVVLDAPVASYPRIAAEVARRHWLTWPLAPLAASAMPRQYNPDSVIDRLAAPLLIFRSDDDRVVPPSHADTLFERATAPKVRIKTTGRHTATFNDEANRQGLLDFLDAHLGGAAKTSRQGVPGERQ